MGKFHLSIQQKLIIMTMINSRALCHTDDDFNATSSIARRERRRRPPQILTYETMGLPREKRFKSFHYNTIQRSKKEKFLALMFREHSIIMQPHLN